jgi:type II secretory pathway pseudopilin PulG
LLAVLAIIGTLIGLLLPAVQRARESGRQSQCLSNQKNIGLAITNYQQAKRFFPAGNEQVTGRFHAWSSYILPFLERSDVAGRIDFMKPWDDPGGNAAITDITIPTYVCPTGMKMFHGKQDSIGVLYATDQAVSRPASQAAIVDGRSNTLLVAEASDREHVTRNNIAATARSRSYGVRTVADLIE